MWIITRPVETSEISVWCFSKLLLLFFFLACVFQNYSDVKIDKIKILRDFIETNKINWKIENETYTGPVFLVGSVCYVHIEAFLPKKY